MKPKGSSRRIIDPLGRIVIPKKLRRSLDINIGDALEFFIDGDKVVLQKYEPGCIFCGETHNVSTFDVFDHINGTHFTHENGLFLTFGARRLLDV